MRMYEPDAIIHQPTRLRIMMLLSGVNAADFNFLLNALKLSKGNLSAQMTKLEEAGYVEITKEFQGKIPRTTYSLTETGTRQLAQYWQVMDSIRNSD